LRCIYQFILESLDLAVMADSVSGIAAGAKNLEKQTPTPGEIENGTVNDANSSQEVLGEDTEGQRDFLRYDEPHWSVNRS
jgi:hypothetical protein